MAKLQTQGRGEERKTQRQTGSCSPARQNSWNTKQNKKNWHRKDSEDIIRTRSDKFFSILVLPDGDINISILLKGDVNKLTNGEEVREAFWLRSMNSSAELRGCFAFLESKSCGESSSDIYECDQGLFVYLNDLILGRLLGQLPDPADKLLVGCVIGFPRVNHPDAQLHQLQENRGMTFKKGKERRRISNNELTKKKNSRFGARTIFKSKRRCCNLIMQTMKLKTTRSWVIRLEAERQSQHPFWLTGGKYNFSLCKLMASAASAASFPHRGWHNMQMCQMCSKSWNTMQQKLTLMSFLHSREIGCLFKTKTPTPKIKSSF